MAKLATLIALMLLSRDFNVFNIAMFCFSRLASLCSSDLTCVMCSVTRMTFDHQLYMYYYFCIIPAAVVVQHDLTSFVSVVHVWFLRWVHVLPLYHLHTFIMQMSDYYL